MKLIVPPFINSLVDDLTKPRRRRITEKEFEAIINRRTDRQMLAALVAGFALLSLVFFIASNPRKAPARNWRGYCDTDAQTAARQAAQAQAAADNADRHF